MATTVGATVDHAGRLAAQMAQTLLVTGECASIIEKHRGGFSIGDVRANRDGTIEAFHQVTGAAQRMGAVVDEMRRSLAESAGFIDATTLSIFERQLESPSAQEKNRIASRICQICETDLGSALRTIDLEQQLPGLAARTRAAVDRSLIEVLPEDEVTSLCEAFYGTKRFIEDLTDVGKESHPNTIEAIQANKAQFDALVAQMEAAFGREKVRGIVFPEEGRVSPSLFLQPMRAPQGHWENPETRSILWAIEDNEALEEALAQMPAELDADGVARKERIEEALQTAKARIIEQIATLPETFRNEIYGQIFALSPEPKGGSNWGKENLTTNLVITRQAFENALETHPEFMTRWVDDEVEHPSAPHSLMGTPQAMPMGSFSAMPVMRWENEEVKVVTDLVGDAFILSEDINSGIIKEPERLLQLELRLAEMKAEIAERTAALPAAFRNEVYGQIYALSPAPKGGHNWGEKNLTKDLNITLQAFEKALENKPEFQPRPVRNRAVWSESDSDGEDTASPLVGASYAAAEAVQMPPAPKTALEVLQRLVGKLEAIKDDDSIDAPVKKGFTTLAFEEAKRQLQEVDPTQAGAILDSIYGLVYQYREDKSQGGHEWGKNHACDSAAVLWAAVVNEMVNRDPSFE
jgi:hypothetical protein